MLRVAPSSNRIRFPGSSWTPTAFPLEGVYRQNPIQQSLCFARTHYGVSAWVRAGKSGGVVDEG